MPLTYSGGWLDRASSRRVHRGWVLERLRDPATRVVPLWRDRCLVTGSEPAPVTVTGEAVDPVLAAAGEVVFLGLDGPAAVFGADLSPVDEATALNLTGATGTLDVRRIVTGLTPADAAVVGYARGLLYWHRNQRFCGSCGAATASRDGGHVRACRGDGCGRLLFPRIEPAVITLVEAPSGPRRCLLGRHSRGAPGNYATLAGFVEVGESLEDAVRREVAEEAGVQVGDVVYQASQAWPFPAGLMVGFRAKAVTDQVRVDGVELHEARWFTPEQLTARLAGGDGLPPLHLRPDSIEKHLVESWLAEPSP